MIFEWDVNKNRTNKRKHGISFELATLAFDDPHLISILDDSGQEQRWISIGLIKGLLLLAVVNTSEDYENEEIIRIISARKATNKEIQQYQAQFEEG